MTDTITVRVLSRCVMCGGESILIVDPQQVAKYNAGAFVQDVWPEKSADWRETWISGSHGYCFDHVFKDEEE